MKTVRTSQFAALSYSALRGALPAGFSAMRGRLGDAEIAVEITNGIYYNLPLSKMFADAGQSAPPPLGDAATDMLAASSATNAPLGFFAFGDFRRELGVRWRGKTGGFGFLPDGANVLAEMSHSASDTLSGTSFGALGAVSGASSKGGKIRMDGAIWNNLSAFGEYAYRDIGAGLSGGLLNARIRNAESSAWEAGVSYADIFRAGDTLRFSARRRAGLEGGEIVLRYPKAVGDFNAAFLHGERQTLSAEETILPLKQDIPLVWTLGYAVAHGKSEWSAAAEYDKSGGNGAISAKWRRNF